MRTLDRYVVRNFLVSALLWLLVLMSIRIVADLFIYFDEFSETTAGWQSVVGAIGSYYAYQSLAYFTELGGIIIVAAAAFTLAMMNHTNELTAIMASGVSLHRVVWPVVVCAMLMGGAVIVDQELVIPRVANKLVRSQDEVLEGKAFPVRLVMDGAGTVWYAPRFDPATGGMDAPQLILRDQSLRQTAAISGVSARAAVLDGRGGWVIASGSLARITQGGDRLWLHRPSYERIYSTVGPAQCVRSGGASSARAIRGEDAFYGMTITASPVEADPDSPEGGVLLNPRFTFAAGAQELCTFAADRAQWRRDADGHTYWQLAGGLLFYPTDLRSEDLVLRQSGDDWMQYMSSSQLGRLLKMERAPDPDQARLIRHTRLTDPLSNLVMLLLALPFILSRERNIKSSASMCLGMVGTYYACVYLARYVVPSPALAAWLPILLFAPVAVLMLDSVKT